MRLKKKNKMVKQFSDCWGLKKRQDGKVENIFQIVWDRKKEQNKMKIVFRSHGIEKNNKMVKQFSDCWGLKKRQHGKVENSFQIVWDRKKNKTK